MSLPVGTAYFTNGRTVLDIASEQWEKIQSSGRITLVSRIPAPRGSPKAFEYAPHEVPTGSLCNNQSFRIWESEERQQLQSGDWFALVIG